MGEDSIAGVTFSVSLLGEGEYSRELAELQVFLLKPVKRATFKSSSDCLVLPTVTSWD